jgi:hypothetical protein
MKSLNELNVPDVMDTSNNDLTREFFAPLLSNSVHYDRGAGYFSSGWQTNSTTSKVKCNRAKGNSDAIPLIV